MKRFALALCVFALTGCDKPESVEYYKSHVELAKADLDKCNNKELKGESCNNARKALSDLNYEQTLQRTKPN